jgi:uridine phosphorylase
MSDRAPEPSRYITPDELLRLRFGDRPRPRWDVGILCFRGQVGSDAMVARLGARPTREKTFYGLSEWDEQRDVHEAELDGRRLVVVSRCLWGGPQAAILVEELACLGVRAIVGFGVAGGLVRDLAKGSQVVASAGIVSDGTSRAYTTLDEAPAGAGLVAQVEAAAAELGIPVAPVRIATVDALYRETREDVRRWLDRGAHAINMETAPLYAAAAACGVPSVWLGHISDTLSPDRVEWESWRRPASLTAVSVALAFALLERIVRLESTA